MTLTPPCDRYAERFAQAFAAHWGLEACSLNNHLISQVKRMLKARGLSAGPSLDELALALVPPAAAVRNPRAAVEAVLTPPAIGYRNTILSPILRDLFDWLRARLSYKFGAACHAHRDDAVSQTLRVLLDYWKPWWSTPEGAEHLRSYALLASGHMTLRILRGEQAREARLGGYELEAPSDPETEAIRAIEERQRAAAVARLRDLDWLLQAGLTRAEASAIVRWMGPEPLAGMDKRALVALRKAFQRGRRRLTSLGERLIDLTRPIPVQAWCTVEHLGLRGRFQVVNSSVHGLLLEGPVDDAALELGAICLVRILSGSTLIVRAAECVRIESSDHKVWIGLQFCFMHPAPQRPPDPRLTF